MTNKERKNLADNYPKFGNTRAKECSAFLSIGISTFYKYIAEGRIKKPIKHGQRVSVWCAEYIRELAKNGIPEKVGGLK